MSEQLTLFAEDTPASPFPQPGDDRARKMTAISGQNLIGSWLNSGPLGSLEKTLLGTSAWGSTVCFLTWKDKVTPAGRLLFQLAPLAQLTGVTGAGPSDKHPLWSTPQAIERRGRHKAGSHLSLTKQVAGWNKDGTMWPTPTRRNAPDCPAERRRKSPSLHARVKMMPTPTAADHRDRGGPSDKCIQRRREIGKSVELSMTVDGPLNPMWVEWLMGFPMGWTDLKPSETQ